MPSYPVSGISARDEWVGHNGNGCLCADKQEVRQRLNLRWGVMPFRLDFDDEPEGNVERTFQLLKRRGLVHSGDLVVVLSDLRPEGQAVVRSAQIRHVP